MDSSISKEITDIFISNKKGYTLSSGNRDCHSTQGALNGFWSAKNEEKNIYLFIYVSEQIKVFNLVEQTCMKLLNKNPAY